MKYQNKFLTKFLFFIYLIFYSSFGAAMLSVQLQKSASILAQNTTGSVSKYFPSLVGQLGLKKAVNTTTDEFSRIHVNPERIKALEAEFVNSEQMALSERNISIKNFLSKNKIHAYGAFCVSGLFKRTIPCLMSQQEAYKILNLSSEASEKDIKKAYRELAKKYHPDVAGTSNTAKMQEIQQAFEIASNKRMATAAPSTSSQGSYADWASSYESAYTSSQKSYSQSTKKPYQDPFDDDDYYWRDFEESMSRMNKETNSRLEKAKQERRERKRREKERRSKETFEEKKAREENERQRRAKETEEQRRYREYNEAYMKREDEIPYGDILNISIANSSGSPDDYLLPKIKEFFQKLKEEKFVLTQEDLDDLLHCHIMVNFSKTSCNPDKYEVVYFLLQAGAHLKSDIYEQVPFLFYGISTKKGNEPIYIKKVFSYLNENTDALKGIWKKIIPIQMVYFLNYNGIPNDLTANEIRSIRVQFEKEINKLNNSIDYFTKYSTSGFDSKCIEDCKQEKKLYEVEIKNLDQWLINRNEPRDEPIVDETIKKTYWQTAFKYASAKLQKLKNCSSMQ